MSIENIRAERKKMIELFAIIIFLGLFINILANISYDIILSLGAEKLTVFYALILVSAAISVVFLLFTFSPIIIKETFPILLILDRKKGNFVYHSMSVFYEPNKPSDNIKIKPSIKNSLTNAKEAWDISEIFVIQLVEYLMLKCLGLVYMNSWCRETILKTDFGGEWKNIKMPSDIVKIKDVINKNNIFYDICEDYEKISIPKNTKMKVNQDYQNKNSQIVLQRKVFRYELFKTLITIKPSLGARGINFVSKDMLNTNAELNENDMLTIVLHVDFYSRFSRLYNFRQIIEKYYKWSEDMLGELKTSFGFKNKLK